VRLIAFSLLLTLPSFVGAWSDHATLAWPYLRTASALNEPTLKAEPLAVFIEAEGATVARVLARVEANMLASDPEYPATPTEVLLSSATGAVSVEGFLRAIRVNPQLGYRLYRQVLPGDLASGDRVLAWPDLSFLPAGTSHKGTRYVPLAPGDPVSVASVLATASDEPDFGMDVGLYEDNGSEHGAIYGLGLQPFGNPNLPYGSQAPLHMGFYHLDWLTRTAQPDLLRTLPMWRITLYRDLAQLAFDTGHDYWGWRFMGWAMHYIGDLTQPYHAEPLPGVSTASALWSVLTGETGNVIQLVSNRHGVLESYQYHRVASLVDSSQWRAPLLEAIAEPQPGCLSPEAVVPELTAASVSRGTALDSVLSDAVPDRFVSDPGFEWVGSGFEAEIVEQIAVDGGDKALAQLDAAIADNLREFSASLQGWVSYGLALQGGSGTGCAQ
jgi:hypothetical protein